VTLTEVDWNQDEIQELQPDPLEIRRMDLETALLMQELMAMREEQTELRSQIFLCEKDNAGLRMLAKMAAVERLIFNTKLQELGAELEEIKNNSNLNSPDDNSERNGNEDSNTKIKTENEYKKRIQELVTTLDQVVENSAQRTKQDIEMIRELKEAHLQLIGTLEKTKAKYRSRIQKLEEHVINVMGKGFRQKQNFTDGGRIEGELQASELDLKITKFSNT
jgi:hypothetical protein